MVGFSLLQDLRNGCGPRYFEMVEIEPMQIGEGWLILDLDSGEHAVFN